MRVTARPKSDMATFRLYGSLPDCRQSARGDSKRYGVKQELSSSLTWLARTHWFRDHIKRRTGKCDNQLRSQGTRR